MKLAKNLSLRFDPQKLESDLDSLSELFVPYEQDENPINLGQVLICPLISPNGSTTYLEPTPTEHPFLPTPYLERASYLKLVLASLPSPIYSVRLISVPPKCGLIQHQDNFRNLRHGIVRLHLPLKTNLKAKMILSDEEYHWPCGELWFGDFSAPHQVTNMGDTNRVHMVIDVGVTTALLSLFPNFSYEQPICYIKDRQKLRPDQLSIFNRLFVMPKGFLPQRAITGLAKIEANETSIELTVNGRGPFALYPISENQLVLENAGCGRVMTFLQDTIELSLLGAVRSFKESSDWTYDTTVSTPCQSSSL